MAQAKEMSEEQISRSRDTSKWEWIKDQVAETREGHCDNNTRCLNRNKESHLMEVAFGYINGVNWF